MRVIGLVALGVLAVVLFLVAPEEGRFSQTPTLVLVGVIALLWHLAWTDALDASADDVGGAPTTTTPTTTTSAAGVDGAAAQRSTRPVPTPPEASHVAAAVSTRDDEEDLSLLPDPPADWPPPGVEVPMVFRAETVEVEVIDLTVRTIGPEPLDADRIDLTADDADRIDLTADDPDRIDLTPGVVAPPAGTPTAEPGRSADDEPDPWLAFAAAMFRDD